MNLLPEFGNLLYVIIAFVVSLSIIVAIHEYGHYIIARFCGIQAEVFSLGFGPVVCSRVDKRGTRWQIAALPLGGYVRFSGDGDAASAMGDGQALRGMTAEERRATMQGAPLWARALTVAAGPFFNFFLSILLFAALFFARGDVAEPIAVGELNPLPASIYGESGLKPGDQLMSIGGVTVPGQDDEALGSFTDQVPVQPTVTYEVRRGDDVLKVQGPYVYPPIVTQLAPNSAAYDAGLEKGDVVTSVDGKQIFSFDQLKKAVETSNGAPLKISVWRNGASQDVTLTLIPRRVDTPTADGGFQTQWRIGVVGGMAFDLATQRAGVLESLWGGVEQTWQVIVSSISGIYHMITGAISSCNMSGPIGIAKTSGAMASQGAVSFLWFVAALSTGVGLLNLFPVPVLDGGHLVFFAYEAVVRRPPSERALRVLMTAGLVLILALMVFSVSNDVMCP